MKKSTQTGWATLELVMLLPCLFGLMGLIFYFGQLAFFRMHLTSAVDAGARVAAIRGCTAGTNLIRQSISSVPTTQISCSEGEIVSIHAVGTFRSQVPFFDAFEKTMTVNAHAYNEQQIEESE
jgi:Flp pilus assembly protein TadG